MNDNRQIIILGGGLTGISCAYHLQERCYIYEKENTPGGLCRSVSLDGFTFDYTGHLLHLRDPYGKKFILDLLKKNIIRKKRNAWVFSKNTFTRYPFQAHTYGLPKKIIKQCLSDYFAAQAKIKRSPKKPTNYHDWIIRNFGHAIAKYFMLPYNQKIWQTDLNAITTEWVKDYVPQPSTEQVLKGSLTDEDSTLGYNTEFYYPQRGGIQSLINALCSRVEHPIELNAEALRVRWYDRRVEIAGKGPLMYRHLVSTMPLPQLMNRMHRVPSDVADATRKLKWISLVCINIGIGRSNITDKHWVYFPEKEFPFYRVGFYHNISPNLVPPHTSSLYIEIAHRPEKKLNLHQTMSATIHGLRRAKIIRADDKILKINFLPIKYAYVIYNTDRTPAVSVIQRFLKSHNIISTGRYGGWKYSYMEEAVLDGKKAAEYIRDHG
ncbi:MAG: NAD(P)-binding protein [Elusimicrobia bacterium]|nr:NAD(P)-binding protein [Elusimicrobiota bacterium]MBD3411805.1 NAD(P)-binding protein [Elusimicrobiota bacterium]